MPLDVFTNADNLSVTGPITVSNDPVTGVGGTITVNGTAGITTTSLNLVTGTTTPQAVATGTAIILIPSGQTVVRISAAAATTGATLPQGTRNGQILIIIITTAVANTVTFAAVGTSFVAGGAAISMAGLSAHMFVWDNTLALWSQIGPVAN